MIFPKILQMVERYDLGTVVFLGDLTDVKDGHSADLVNTIADNLVKLAEKVVVYLLKGNHDYQDVNQPFFNFLSYIPGLRFIRSVEEQQIGELKCLFLPHTKQHEQDWLGYKWTNYDRIFTHQCYRGALTPSGTGLEGVPTQSFESARPDTHIIAGDIHTPQWVGRILYTGSPYPVHFGDNFKPRVLVEQEGVLKSVGITSIQKFNLQITCLEDLGKTEIYPEDQVKVTIRLMRSRFHEYNDMKTQITAWAAQNGLLLAGIELKEITRPKIELDTEEGQVRSIIGPHDVLKRFCEGRQVEEDLMREGLELLGGDK